MAAITSIVYQTEESKHEEPYRYNRTPAESVTLRAGHGIEGDRKAGHHPNRQLNVMAAEMVAQLASEGYKTQPGELGEQIIISGVDLVAVLQGGRLQLGDEAVIELGGWREPCSWFELIQNKTIAESEERIGVMAKVLIGGTIRVGDTVKVLQAESQQA